MKLHTSLLQVFFLQSLQPHNHLVCLLETDRPHLHFGCIAHPHWDGRQNFTSPCTLFYSEACSNGALSTIECNHMSQFCYINSCTPWIIEVQSINDKISTVQLLIRRHEVTRAGFSLDPHLKVISMGTSYRRRMCLLLDFFSYSFSLELCPLKDFLLVTCILN